jgi:hypothetical protein
MLSAATFLGIARATLPASPTAEVRPVPGGSAHAAPGAGGLQPARVLSTPSLGAIPMPQSGIARPPPTVSPTPQTPPPRNLPRGSLLDLSV